MSDRLICMVPHCRRSTSSFTPEWPDDGWICSLHWAAVPGSWKQVKRRVRRALRSDPLDVQTISRFRRISSACTRRAIEAGAGLS